MCKFFVDIADAKTMALLRWLFHPNTINSLTFEYRKEIEAAAVAARERLQRHGLLQVEINAQKEVEALVQAARVGRDEHRSKAIDAA